MLNIYYLFPKMYLPIMKLQVRMRLESNSAQMAALAVHRVQYAVREQLRAMLERGLAELAALDNVMLFYVLA